MLTLERFIMITIMFLLAAFTQVLAEPETNGPRIGMSTKFIIDEDFTEFKSIKDIPQSVKNEFIKLSQNPTFMADPGQSFAIGCVRSENLPSRRLIFGAANSNHCLLFYEKGGYAHQYLIAVFELNTKTCRPIWKGAPSFAAAAKIKSFGELKQVINSGKTSETSFL